MRISIALCGVVVGSVLSLGAGCCRLPSGQGGSGGDGKSGTGQKAGAQSGGTGYQANGFPVSMPTSRTAVPSVSEWSAAPVLTTRKFPPGCSMKMVREWMKINCSRAPGARDPVRITDVNGMGGFGADYFTFEKDGAVIDLVVRTVNGKSGSATFVLKGGTHKVGYNWPYGAPFPSTVFEG